MRTTRKQDFLLGLTIIIFTALFVGGFIFLYPSLKAGGQPITVWFQHEEGIAPLTKGSPVLLSSIEVGKVVDVHIDQMPAPADPKKTVTAIVVRARILSKFELFDDCQITTDQPAIGGLGSLVILNVGVSGTRVTGEHPIKGLPPQSLAAAISTLSRRLLGPGGLLERLDHMLDPALEGSVHYRILTMLADLNAMTGELRLQLSTAEQQTLLSKLHLILNDVNSATTALRAQTSLGNESAFLVKLLTALDKLNAGLTETTDLVRENRPTVRQVLTGVQTSVETVNSDLLAALRTEFNREDSASLLGQLHVSMDRINGSLTGLGEASEAAKTIVLLNRPTIDRTLANIAEMSNQLKLASQEIRLMPSKLIWGPGPAVRDRFGVFEAARTFAEAATYLDDAAARLEAVSEAGRPGGDEEVQKVREALRAAFERFQRAEDFLYDRLKAAR